MSRIVLIGINENDFEQFDESSKNKSMWVEKVVYSQKDEGDVSDKAKKDLKAIWNKTQKTLFFVSNKLIGFITNDFVYFTYDIELEQEQQLCSLNSFFNPLHSKSYERYFLENYSASGIRWVSFGWNQLVFDPAEDRCFPNWYGNQFLASQYQEQNENDYGLELHQSRKHAYAIRKKIYNKQEEIIVSYMQSYTFYEWQILESLQNQYLAKYQPWQIKKLL